MTPDNQLLRQYADTQDEAAFAELVRRHVDLVYSVALRQAHGDVPLAEDATQSVFTDLARKAGLLSRRETLAGWLHTSARYAAGNAIRSEQRRRAREMEVVIMHENTTVADLNWEQLRPLLDECVGSLKEADRDALVLRFFEGKSHQEIGALLGLSENSANKRVERALEKLRAYFTCRGITISSALLATTITENSVQAAPVYLAGKVSVASLVGVGGPLAGGISSAVTSAFFMKTKTQVIIAIAVFFLIFLLALNWPSSDETPAPAESAPLKPVASAVAKVAAPVLAPVAKSIPSPLAMASPVQAAPPVVQSAPAAPVVPRPGSNVADSPTNPRVEVKTAMTDFVNLLQMGDYTNAIETYMQIPAKMTGQQLVDAMSSNPDFPKTVQMLIDATTAAKTTPPVYDETGNFATYNLSPPTAGKTLVRWKKINGLWYVDAFE